MRKRTAREMETEAALLVPARATAPPGSEALAMLHRRGFRATPSRLDLPFDRDLGGEVAERLTQLLRHYSFRLFLRGAILDGQTFTAHTATSYVGTAKARLHAEALVAMGLAAREAEGRYRLLRPAHSFGATLEWWVARELRTRFGFDTAVALKFRARGVGGDLDVVAAAEGKLVTLELKTSPPKHLKASEVNAFLGRVRALRPDVAVFVVDTALRLADKVVPMFAAALPEAPRRVERELWAATPHLYLVNAKPDLIGNIGRAIAEGFRAVSPAY